MCHLLIRFTLCAHSSGFSELSNAVWQANLEFNFRRWDHLRNKTNKSSDEASILDDFTAFWESEDLRIGEDTIQADPERTLKEPADATVRDWDDLEGTASRLAEFSARTTDRYYGDDPYNIVFVSDVAPYLLRPQTFEEHGTLLEAFLVFCQLPPFLKHGQASYWLQDPYVRIQSTMISPPTGKTNVGVKPAQGLSNTTALGFQLDEATLFADSDLWYNAFQSAEHRKSRSAWCRRILRAAVEREIGGEELAEYYLALTLTEAPEIARDEARAILRLHPASVRLWNALMCITMQISSIERTYEVARMVLDTNRNNIDAMLLWKTWIWFLVEQGSYDRALLQFPKMTDFDNDLSSASAVTPIMLLRARKVSRYSSGHVILLFHLFPAELTKSNATRLLKNHADCSRLYSLILTVYIQWATMSALPELSSLMFF